MKNDGSKRLSHLSQHAQTLSEYIKARPNEFFLVVGFLLPGPPRRTACFLFQRVLPHGEDPVFDTMFEEFVNGTDEQRIARFKYLPRLDVAPKAVLSSVRMIGGEKPTMLCKKLTPRFFRGDNYVEVNIDVASSSVANMVTGFILPKVTVVVVSH